MGRERPQTVDTIIGWIDTVVIDLYRQFRCSLLPPLMVYFAAGISGLTAIVGAFFVKEYLGLSAAFLSELAFWAGIPWALKMPLGHLVDLICRWKALLIFLGAGLVAASLSIMSALVTDLQSMAAVMPIKAWYVLSALLAPSGYVVQDSVADAMSVEAVPHVDDDGRPFDAAQTKTLHTMMQNLGLNALISGLVAVALLNIFMFSGIETACKTQRGAGLCTDLSYGAGHSSHLGLRGSAGCLAEAPPPSRASNAGPQCARGRAT